MPPNHRIMIMATTPLSKGAKCAPSRTASGDSMRYSLKEGVFFGVIIGASVLLIRAFVRDALLSQLLLLALVAIILIIAQLLLGLRRARPQNHQSPIPPTQPERPRNQRHAQSQD